MWSGPRNLSTALMYAFAARRDCSVVDEPFYAAYLSTTGVNHPMRTDVMASQPTDPGAIAAILAGPIPLGRPVFYQKHMAHHLLPAFPRDWMAAARHVLLIRHPARVIASYAAKREAVTLHDIGIVQQRALRHELAVSGQRPAVIDGTDIRADPPQALRALCADLGLRWDPAMLRWPAGGHPDDGVWAKYWYGAVHRSTGFAGPEGALPEVPATLSGVLAEALPFYEELVADRIVP